jgi:hypothetical protein
MEDAVVIIEDQIRKRRRFYVLDRAIQKARQEIMNQEKSEMFKVLGSESSNNTE